MYHPSHSTNHSPPAGAIHHQPLPIIHHPPFTSHRTIVLQLATIHRTAPAITTHHSPPTCAIHHQPFTTLWRHSPPTIHRPPLIPFTVQLLGLTLKSNLGLIFLTNSGLIPQNVEKDAKKFKNRRTTPVQFLKPTTKHKTVACFLHPTTFYASYHSSSAHQLSRFLSSFQ